MNKPFDPKKPGKAVAVDAPQVPAQPRLPSKWKQFRRLTDDADEIRGRHDELHDLMEFLHNRKSGEPPPDIRDAQLDDYDKQQIARCRQWLPDIDRVDYYEEGDEDEGPILKKKIISERLALMLGAVHIGGPQTPEAFLKMLLEHVYDAEVSYLALESGCRQIEHTQKYVPAISEVLKVLNEHQKQWATRKWALGGIESISNNLQEQIRKAWAKYAGERLDEAKNRLKGDVWQINDAQARARQAYQNVEAGIDQLAKDRAALEAAVAAAEAANAGGDEVVGVAAPPVPVLPQSRNEWQQFRILMNDLDEVRERYDLLRPGGVKPSDLPYVRLKLRKKLQIDRCLQWLQEIDRVDYYEEAVVVRDNGPLPTSVERNVPTSGITLSDWLHHEVHGDGRGARGEVGARRPKLSEETISKRLSVMLGMVIDGRQDPELFLQHLSQYVYGAEVSYLVLESACREIEQTGKCPTISKVLELLKEHQERWDKRKSALDFIEVIQKHFLKTQARYAREQLKETEDLLRKRQEEASEAYQRVEAAMERLAKDQQRSAEAKAALDAAGAAAKAVDDDRQA